VALGRTSAAPKAALEDCLGGSSEAAPQRVAEQREPLLGPGWSRGKGLARHREASDRAPTEAITKAPTAGAFPGAASSSQTEDRSQVMAATASPEVNGGRTSSGRRGAAAGAGASAAAGGTRESRPRLHPWGTGRRSGVSVIL
jgi:hypothetical protein